MALPSHTVWFCVAAVEVKLIVDFKFLVTVPVMVAAVQGSVCPVVVMVYVPLAVGVPLMRTTLLLRVAVKPAGRLAMVADAADPPIV